MALAGLLLGGVVVSIMAGCGGENNTPPLPTTGSVTGRVVDYYSGVGLGGTTITVGGRSAVSGADGTFVVSGVAAGTYTVTITPPAGLILPAGAPAVVVTVVAGQSTPIVNNIVLMDAGDVPPSPPTR